jgi:hypothetical protein
MTLLPKLEDMDHQCMGHLPDLTMDHHVSLMGRHPGQASRPMDLPQDLTMGLLEGHQNLCMGHPQATLISTDPLNPNQTL